MFYFIDLKNLEHKNFIHPFANQINCKREDKIFHYIFTPISIMTVQDFDFNIIVPNLNF